MAKQSFVTGQVLTAAQMTSLQQTAMGGGSATAKTASYVLVAADAGTTVAMNAAGSTTITVNTSLFAAGDVVFIQNLGAGATTITAGTATVTTSGSLVLAQNQGGKLYFTSASAAIFFQFATPASSGDIEGVTAGTGISGGGTSGTVTITNSMATAIDAKGDLVAGTGADAFSRLAVGTNNQVLVADSAEATGLKWATPTSSAASWTQISDTRVLSVSSHTVSSLGTYNRLYIALSEVTPASGTRQFIMTLNGSTSAVYRSYRFNFGNATTWDPYVINSGGNYNSPTNYIELANASSTVGVNGVINIDNMLSANDKLLNYAVGSSPIDGARAYIGGSTFAGSAITSFTISFVAANISDGRVIVYGSTN